MSPHRLISAARQADIANNILDELGVRVSYWDTNQICLYTNRFGLEWFGKSHDEVIGHSAREVFGSRLYELNLPHFLKAVGGVAETFERDITTPDGDSRSLLVTYSPALAAGHVTGVIISVTNVTSLKKMERELKIAKETAEALATRDTLTGLPNRVTLDDRVGQCVLQARQTKTIASVMTLDVDGFKMMNDTYGHFVGDAVLKSIAKRLTEATRDTDTVARLGGDEFIVLARSRSIGHIEHLASRILEIVNRPIKAGKATLQVGISIGIACYPAHGRTARTLMKRSDDALYAAKRQGKNRHVVWGRHTPKGHGDSQPVAHNKTPDGRARTRRVALKK